MSVLFFLFCSIYSGTVAGAREAFLYGIPAIAMSYDWYAKNFLL
jgi:broad specificity polyphosphatase/5'/3'-nucleotidase SurE